MIISHYRAECPLKIALVADLHEDDPEEVLAILKKEKPRLITIAGDSLERYDYNAFQKQKYPGMQYYMEVLVYYAMSFFSRFLPGPGDHRRAKNVYHFLREANKIAPVCMSLGNHELYLTDRDYKVIRETGTILLDNQFRSVLGITVGGLSSAFSKKEVDADFLDRFEKEPGYRLLLCHHPEYYDKYLKNRKIDLIFSGHCHGGQVRIFNKGLFAPGQGIFPRYSHGRYENMIVSSGCSNTADIPRWGNPCEVVIIDPDPDCVPEKDDSGKRPLNKCIR